MPSFLCLFDFPTAAVDAGCSWLTVALLNISGRYSRVRKWTEIPRWPRAASVRAYRVLWALWPCVDLSFLYCGLLMVRMLCGSASHFRTAEFCWRCCLASASCSHDCAPEWLSCSGCRIRSGTLFLHLDQRSVWRVCMSTFFQCEQRLAGAGARGGCRNPAAVGTSVATTGGKTNAQAGSVCIGRVTICPSKQSCITWGLRKQLVLCISLWDWIMNTPRHLASFCFGVLMKQKMYSWCEYRSSENLKEKKENQHCYV